MQIYFSHYRGSFLIDGEFSITPSGPGNLRTHGIVTQDDCVEDVYTEVENIIINTKSGTSIILIGVLCASDLVQDIDKIIKAELEAGHQNAYIDLYDPLNNNDCHDIEDIQVFYH